MSQDQIFETPTQKLARQAAAVADLPHQETSIHQAATRAALEFWPEMPLDLLNDLTQDAAESQAHAIANIRRGYKATVNWEDPSGPIIKQDIDPVKAWTRLLADVYGITEAATLGLRSYDRDDKDPETGLPITFINRYNRHISGRYDGGE